MKSLVSKLIEALVRRLGNIPSILIGISCVLLLVSERNIAQEVMFAKQNNSQSLQFDVRKIASESFESAGVFDVNKDGVKDIVSGVFWYKGPDFIERYTIGTSKRFGEYYDDFATIAMDVNGDDWIDFVTGGWFGENLRWYENPGNEKHWPEHIFAQSGNVEAARAWDVDGDGTLEIVPNTPNDSLVIYRLTSNETRKFEAHRIFGKHGHGLGFGDINGDGRGDFIVEKGWIEAPEKPFDQGWTFHSDFDLGQSSVPIIVADINSDGWSDFIVGQGHGYGLHWYEQKVDKKSNLRSWVKHVIDSEHSQFHTMEWTDLDGDGSPELVTGKRYRAHSGKDPGSNDPYGTYYYKWRGDAFEKHTITFGKFGETKGTGIFFVVTELTDSGMKDIIVAGKDGLYIFYNKGYD